MVVNNEFIISKEELEKVIDVRYFVEIVLEVVYDRCKTEQEPGDGTDRFERYFRIGDE